jgi:glycosyltransferase involved in cell wall biosynthesis
LRSRAFSLGIGDQVTFTGQVSHVQVMQLMRKQDIVIVPTRWDYDEGFPSTIVEALAARTPLIVSDHPAFAGRLTEGEEVLVFKAGNPESLASTVRGLLENPPMYERLSDQSGAAHDKLYFGIKWKELMKTFIDDPYNKTGWVNRNSLSTLLATRHSKKR